MMRKNVFIFFILSIFTFPQEIYAQKLKASTEMLLNLRLVELMEKYERYGNIDKGYEGNVARFISLFINPESKVYNDILGLSDQDSLYLSVRDYANLLSKNSETTRVEIKNINKRNLRFEDNLWKVDCVFDKYVNLTDQCGIEYASDFFKKTDYHLTATIRYDLESDVCTIEKISGNVESLRELPANFRVINNKSKSIKDLLYNGEKPVFNAMGQAFVSPLGSFTSKDADIIVKVVEDSCRQLDVRLTPKRWRVKFYYDIPLGSALSFQNDLLLNIDKNTQHTFGLDFGYILPSKKNIKTGVYFGTSVTNSRLNLSNKNTQFYYNTNQDIDGDYYERHYNNFTLSQYFRFVSIALPVYFDFALKMNTYFSLYADLGVRLGLNLIKNVDDVKGQADIYGIYHDYDDLRLDENWGYNGFGKIMYSKSDLIKNEIADSKLVNVDLLAGAGIRFSIPHTPLSLELGVTYNHGVTNMIESGKTVQLNGGISPLIYNSIQNTQSKEFVRQLTETIDNVSASSLKLHMGISYKF